jgi:uncharacterized SAM-binding protein YcdF (DUF218 family)
MPTARLPVRPVFSIHFCTADADGHPRTSVCLLVPGELMAWHQLVATNCCQRQRWIDLLGCSLLHMSGTRAQATAVELGHRSLAPSILSGLRHIKAASLRALALLGLAIVIVVITPLDSWWAGELAGRWDDPAGDILIVLGGSVLDDGQIGGSSYWRCMYGAIAYREGGFKQVIITGGGHDAVPIAESMKHFLIFLGVPVSVIEVESHAMSTRENALFVKRMIAGRTGRKVLLTSDYHMFRAYRVFEKAGIDVQPRPYPDVRKRAGSWRGRVPAFIDLLEESVKIVYYRAHGWI